MGRKIRITRAGIIVFLIVILLAVSGTALYLQLRTDAIGQTVRQNDTIRFLFIVGDGPDFSQVVLFQTGTGKCAIFDVPGNTGALISEKNRIDRIESVFDEGRPQAYIEQVEELMGIDISHYLSMSRDELSAFIDLLEGVDLFIANPVEFQSEEMVLIPSGSVSLDGPKAVRYGTYVEPGERESDKISRRQKLVQALFKKLGEMQAYLAYPNVAKTAYTLFSTDLSYRAFASLLQAYAVLDEDQFIFQRVLGKNREVEGEMLLFPHYGGALLKETVEQTEKSLRNKEVMSAEQLNISIEILNGTLNNGLAGRTSQVFKSYGYDVARVANAEKQDRERTVIIAGPGSLSAAKRVAEIIKCKNIVEEDMIESIGPDTIDVSVILGKDFDGRYCKN